MKDLELFLAVRMNHLVAVDVKGSIGLTGKEAEETLDSVGITCNKNTIPLDKKNLL